MSHLRPIIVSLFLSLAIVGKGQVAVNLKELSFTPTEYGISSLCYDNGVFYMPAERMPVIYRFDPMFRPLTADTFKSIHPYEMEGCTYFKGGLYLLSENKAALYRRKADGTLATVLDHLPEPVNNDGMEGLTTNGTDRFYLLLERKKIKNHWSAILYTYGLNTDTTISLLTLINTAEIELPSEAYRYSDILYDASSNTLLLLRSKINEYAIEQVTLTKNGFPEIRKRRKILDDTLSKAANKYNEVGFDNNLEGMTMFNNVLYIVSDNCFGFPGKCKRRKTMLLEITGLNLASKNNSQ
jgi:Esterase-like activity of phytase